MGPHLGNVTLGYLQVLVFTIRLVRPRGLRERLCLKMTKTLSSSFGYSLKVEGSRILLTYIRPTQLTPDRHLRPMQL